MALCHSHNSKVPWYSDHQQKKQYYLLNDSSVHYFLENSGVGYYLLGCMERYCTLDKWEDNFLKVGNQCFQKSMMVQGLKRLN